LNARIRDSSLEFAQNFKFDYILSSETVYNIESLPGLASLIKLCLKPNGTMYGSRVTESRISY